MRIHHISCGTFQPVGGRAVDGYSHGLRARLVCHCWLIEGPRGLILVDTGFGTADVLNSDRRRGRLFNWLIRPQLSLNSTARAHVLRLGFQVEDVRDIVLTHLDADHIGGIADFPNATLHCLKSEFDAAANPRTWRDRWRYRRFSEYLQRQWKLYASDGNSSSWYGLNGICPLEGLKDVMLVPLPGHSWGHCGVAVLTDQGWMLHAGDSYFYREEMEHKAKRWSLGLKLFQNFVEVNHALRMVNQRRLRQLLQVHGRDIRVCCSHDAIELAAYQASAETIRTLHRQHLNRPHSVIDQTV